MGVDCKVTLSPGTRVRDVALALGAALGCKKTWGGTSDGKTRWVEVEGVRVRCDGMPGCASIECGERWFCYHFEYGADGARGVTLRSFAENIAVGRKLAEFFGGSVEPNDWEGEVVWSTPYRTDCHAEDGEEWDAFQARLFAVEPVTAEEIAECQTWAGYK